MYRLIYLAILSFLPVFLGATSIFDQLVRENAHEAVDVQLILPLDSLLARSEEEQNSGFVFTDASGKSQKWSVKVGTRGKFRRSRCEMPPLKLNFSKKDLRAAGLEDHDKYKLVIPCFSNEQGEELVMKEYLAYRAYELLTPHSFRTQLLKITIQNVNSGDSHQVTGFIIENTGEMAARVGGVEMEDLIGAAPEKYNPQAEVTHALFQFFVGNGDWSLVLGRNVKIIKIGEEYIPVGYDFDFTGWVGAPYATANSNIGQKSIYERVYLGYAQRDEVINDVRHVFAEKRRDVMKLLNKADLSFEGKSMTQRFAVRFYAQINRLAVDKEVTLYDQLRGDIATLIPAGEEVNSFRSMGK